MGSTKLSVESLLLAARQGNPLTKKETTMALYNDNVYRSRTVTDKIDVIMSSVRPFGEDKDYAALQRKAIKGWAHFTTEVVLFSEPTDVEGLDVPITFEVPSSNPPTIKEMIEYAVKNYSEHTVVAICNSDITLTDGVLRIKSCAKENSLSSTWAATSLRHEYEKDDLASAKVEGMGLDFFVATVNVWQHMIKEIPPYMTLGRQQWDTFVNTWFRRRVQANKYFNITDWKCVYHPKHSRKEGRLLDVFKNKKAPKIMTERAYTVPHLKFPMPQ
jgi:hypothetical protein